MSCNRSIRYGEKEIKRYLWQLGKPKVLNSYSIENAYFGKKVVIFRLFSAKISGKFRVFRYVCEFFFVKFADFDKKNLLEINITGDMDSKTEQKLLRVLVENRGRTLPRSVLVDKIWTDGAEYVDENALSVTIKRLRDKTEMERYEGFCAGFGRECTEHLIVPMKKKERRSFYGYISRINLRCERKNWLHLCKTNKCSRSFLE